MTALLLTPAARTDLSDIWDYTAATWGLVQAETYIRSIVAMCEAVADGSTTTQSATHIRAGYRKAHAGRHIVYFRQTDDQTVVIRILHQRMDVDTHL